MIHRIRIQNYKSLRDVTVHLSPVTVFVGKSGTGKTNFASAIQFLRDCLRARSRGAPIPDDRNRRCATSNSEEMAFEIEFDVPGFIDRFRYTLSLDASGLNKPPRLESLEHGTQTVFRQARSDTVRGGAIKWEVEPRLTSPPKPGAVVLGHLPGLEEPTLAYTVLSTGIGVYSFPYNVLATPKPNGDTSGLVDNGGNYLNTLKDLATNLNCIDARKGIVATLQRVNPTVASIDLDSLQSPKTAIVGHRLGDKILTLELAQESDGFRRFYAHLLALYQIPSKQTMIFEEPENGIYPGALSLLAEEFKAAPAANRGQVLLTTHSPALLDHFSAEQIRVVELVDLETQIGPLAVEQTESLREELLRPGELLTVDPARRAEA